MALQQLATTTTVAASVPPVSTDKMIHTRSCNGREVCSCFLRLQSAYFQKNLDSKRRQKAKREAQQETQQFPATADSATGAANTALVVSETSVVQQTPPRKKRRVVRTYRKVSNLLEFDAQVIEYLATFMQALDLARLSMVTRTMRKEIEVIAQRGADMFVSAPARANYVLKDEKQETETWTRYLHVQMNCVHRMFVYYTGYKTGQMRRDFPYWSFGVVEINPNDPAAVVLPNTWKFHEHEPWLRQRANGKDGEWRLRDAYKRGRAPRVFTDQVKQWATALRPGSFVAVAYQNAGSEEPAWWEAQVWHLWRAQEDSGSVTVYDAEADTTLAVRPEDLLEHFKHNPLHVVDVCSTPRKVCTICARYGKSFYYCHVERGHPML